MWPQCWDLSEVIGAWPDPSAACIIPLGGLAGESHLGFYVPKELLSFEVTPREGDQLLPLFLRLCWFGCSEFISWGHFKLEWLVILHPGKCRSQSSPQLNEGLTKSPVCLGSAPSLASQQGRLTTAWHTPELSRRRGFSWSSPRVSFLCPSCPHTLSILSGKLQACFHTGSSQHSPLPNQSWL